MNFDNPTACSLDEFSSERDRLVDLAYVKTIIDWVESNPSKFDGRIYIEGFSQNAMFSEYIAFCLHQKISGVWAQAWWKGGDDYTTRRRGWNGAPWPCFSKEGPVTTCIGEYSNDNRAIDRKPYYDLLVKEGHNPNFFRFAPSTDGTLKSRHSMIPNRMHWMVGCWGLTSPCSPSCEDLFFECMKDSDVSTDKKRVQSFSACIFGLKTGECSECAPTLKMLESSQRTDSQMVKDFGGAEPRVNNEPPEGSHCIAPDVWDVA